MSLKSVVSYKKDLMSLYWEIKPVISKFKKIRQRVERDRKLTDEEREEIEIFIESEFRKIVREVPAIQSIL